MPNPASRGQTSAKQNSNNFKTKSVLMFGFNRIMGLTYSRALYTGRFTNCFRVVRKSFRGASLNVLT